MKELLLCIVLYFYFKLSKNNATFVYFNRTYFVLIFHPGLQTIVQCIKQCGALLIVNLFGLENGFTHRETTGLAKLDISFSPLSLSKPTVDQKY